MNNITGVTAGFEQPLTKNLKVSVFNSYDNINHDVVGVSLTATFGEDSTVFSNNINDRLLDPVERHIGIIDTGAGTYDQQNLENVGKDLQYDNIYFVAPDDDSDNNDNLTLSTGYGATTTSTADIGTYGSPASLNQTTLNSINQLSPSGSRIYIQGGTNANYYVNSNTAEQSSDPNNDYGLVLYANEDVYGRTTDYTTPATGNERPNILVDGENNYNGFIITGSENTLSDLIITTESGYINGTTPTTSTGIIAYNESEADQTIQITNTSISGFADGMYAQNDSDTATMTINADYSNFDDNGGDQGLDNIQVAGYNNDGSAGLIAINNSGSSNQLIINTTYSSFDNNGTFSGENSGINNNNNNFSLASGLTAINNSNTGGLTINANYSTFDNNGTLSGLNTYILANEAGANDNSINTAAATGLYALNNSSNSAAMTINATHSNFDNNGTLSGENALIKSGGTGSGDNVNTAIASGVYIFNNSSGSALITLNADYSSFDNNGTLSGSGSNIFILADNPALGTSENATAATGVFSFNDSDNEGNININATHSTFDYNGTLSGDNSEIYAHTTDSNDVQEDVMASASGILAYNSDNQGNNAGSTTVTADYSSFNNNGELSGDNASITSLNDNGFGTGSSGIASSSGISGYNISAGNLTIKATNSEFNNNSLFSGTGNDISSINSDTNTSASSGLFILNNSGTGGNIYVTNLSGSSFNNNGTGTTGYGIFAYTPNISGITSIDYTGATFGGSPQTNTNQDISAGTTEWIS